MVESEDVEQHLRPTQCSLAEMQVIAHLGSWDFNISTRRATWSDETYRIFGVDPEAFIPSYEALVERIHPDDRASFDKNYANSVANHGIHDIDLRIVMDNGAIRYIHTRGRTYYDDADRPQRSIGTVLDITERRIAELALAESEKRYRDLVESTSDLIWETDCNGCLIYVSPSVHRVVGYRPEEVIGKPITMLMRPAEATIVADRMREAVANREPICGIESAVVRKDGTEIEVEANITPEFDTSGVVGYRGSIHDISERKKTEACLKKSETQLSNALALTRAARWEFDVATNLFTFNDMFYAILGTTAEEVGGYEMSPTEYAERFVYPDDIPVIAGEVQIALETSDPNYSRELEHRFVYANGEKGVLAVMIRVLQDENGRTIKTYGVNQDITKRKRMEQELSLSKALSATAMESSLDGILIIDADMKVISHNQVFAKMWGIRKKLLEAGDDLSLLHSITDQLTDADAFFARVSYLYDHPDEAGHDEIELKDGQIFDRDTVPLYDDNGKYLGRAWFFRDITERKKAEATIIRMARYDAVTNLVNRHVFREALEQSIARAFRSESSFAVLYLDLDNFKDINDTLGHLVGDLLLKAAAKRLRRNMRKIDTIARLGGDEFAIIIADCVDPTRVAVVAEKILTSMSEPFFLRGNEIRTGTSIGIAMFGSESPDAETLQTHADMALYRAKSEGRATFRFFTHAMDREIQARVALSKELHAAIGAGQLVVFYQPELEIETGRIIGVEALVRWDHPTRGLIGPGEFVPVAEKTGLINALGRWVMREACRQAKAWMDMQIAPDFVAINISALQFKTPHELEKDIEGALADSGLPAHKLECELTETVLMDASARHGDAVQRLRDQGVRIAIDDFGTGFSSLDYLRRFHVDRIKIAQTFVTDLETVQGNRAIVRAALGLARELNLGVIAEGIETKEQLDLLRGWGCLEGQGYYFARPLPVREMTELLRKRRGLYAASDVERAQGANSDLVLLRPRSAG